MKGRFRCGRWWVVVDIIKPTIHFVIYVLNILSLSYDTHSPRWCLVCSREALPVCRWSLSATYTSACRYPIWLRTLLRFLDLLFTELNITCCPMDAVTFDLSCPGGGWSIPDPSSIMCKNDFKIGGIELDSDVVGKEPVNYCWRERYPSRRIRFRCCFKSTCKFLLNMKIFFTKYLAALKIMETYYVVLFPFTSRTALPRSSNTRD